jgi:hypothetical protein
MCQKGECACKISDSDRRCAIYDNVSQSLGGNEDLGNLFATARYYYTEKRPSIIDL